VSVAALVGWIAALVPTYVTWRVGQALCVWAGYRHAPRIVPHLVSVAITLPVAAWGNGSGGSLDWPGAVIGYVPAALCWYLYDHWRAVRRARIAD